MKQCKSQNMKGSCQFTALPLPPPKKAKQQQNTHPHTLTERKEKIYNSHTSVHNNFTSGDCGSELRTQNSKPASFQEPSLVRTMASGHKLRCMILASLCRKPRPSVNWLQEVTLKSITTSLQTQTWSQSSTKAC